MTSLRDRQVFILCDGLQREGFALETDNYFEPGGVEHIIVKVGLDNACIGEIELVVSERGRKVERRASSEGLQAVGRRIFDRHRDDLRRQSGRSNV